MTLHVHMTEEQYEGYMKEVKRHHAAIEADASIQRQAAERVAENGRNILSPFEQLMAVALQGVLASGVDPNKHQENVAVAQHYARLMLEQRRIDADKRDEMRRALGAALSGQ